MSRVCGQCKLFSADPEAKEGCIYRIENAGALVQAERKSIARGALDVIPKGSTLTGELVPGRFEHAKSSCRSCIQT